MRSPGPTLFTLSPSPAVTFTITTPSPKVYLLAFSSPPDNRLTPTFLSTFHLALDILASQHPHGVLITTSSLPKFYSNGLDLAAAQADMHGFLSENLYPLWRRLLTYPMPTVALLNGHAFAGGFMTAMMHDYRVMNPERGYLCLNELEFGSAFLPPMVSLFRVKVPKVEIVREIMLEARRYPGKTAKEKGLVDEVGGLEEALKFVEERQLVEKAKGSVCTDMKEELYREVVRDLDGLEEWEIGEKRRKEEGKTREEGLKKRIENWQRAKL
ncbi:MAG: hypothetical protein Q9160_003963 [Pyrenula sp. 1 TL-2023]